tara:strand:- start:197122 stop:198531 length:1410 start_codon:yes stop_codon:yes gene_type:complete
MKSFNKSFGALLLASALTVPSMSQAFAQEVDQAVENEVPSCIKSGAAYTKRMNGQQRKQLYVQGTITDCQDRVWDITLIPGSDTSKNMTVKAFKRSGERIANNTKHIIEGETYANLGQDIKDTFVYSYDMSKNGLSTMKDGAKNAFVDGIGKTMIMKTGRDWANGFSNAGAVAADGNFGWPVGVIYSGLLKPAGQTVFNVGKALVWDVTLKGGGKVIWGGLKTVTGGAGMIASPLLSPGYQLILRPLGALTISVLDTVAVGGIASGAVYVWNGAAWTLSQLSDVPTRESSVAGLTLVDLEFDPDAPENQHIVANIEFNTFAQMIQAQVANVQKNNNQKPYESALAANKEEIKRLRSEIEKLQDENDELYDKIKEEKINYDQNPVVKAINEMRYSARYQADEIVIADDVKLVVRDFNSLKELVLATANEMNVEMSNEEAEEVANELIKTFSEDFGLEDQDQELAGQVELG